MMKKFQMTIKTLSKERDKYKAKNSEQIKIIESEREKEITDLKNHYDQMLKNMTKDKDDRISRLFVENRSLKERISHYEM